MKILLYLIISISFVFLSGCVPKPSEPVEERTSRITGFVTIDGQPVVGAVVQVDNNTNWKFITNDYGEFIIDRVTQGQRLFTVRKDIDGGKVIQQETQFQLKQDLHEMGEVKLVHAVDLAQPVEIDQTYIRLSWTQAVNNDFAEYRVYRRNSPGVDYRNGDLIFSSNSISDTEFLDRSYRTGMGNYYRVYVFSPSGARSGSNAESLTLPEVNLLPNGDFEVSSDGKLPDNWLLRTAGTPEFDYFQVVNEPVQSGQRSVKVYYDGSRDTPDPILGSWGGLSHTILTNDWVVGKDYTLAFWVNAQIGNYMVRIVKNADMENPILSYVVYNENGWKEKKINFQIDGETNYIQVWVSTRPGQSANGIVTGFIDNMKIIK
jgi:hypothetical protein